MEWVEGDQRVGILGTVFLKVEGENKQEAITEGITGDSGITEDSGITREREIDNKTELTETATGTGPVVIGIQWSSPAQALVEADRSSPVEMILCVREKNFRPALMSVQDSMHGSSEHVLLGVQNAALNDVASSYNITLCME